MADKNLCRGLKVCSIETDSPFFDMYMLQLKLQERLDQVPNNLDCLSLRVPNVIYWGYCVDDEFIELIEWFKDHPHMADSDTLKEARMEFIDMLHFIFNKAISLSIPATQFHTKLQNVVIIPDTVDSAIQAVEQLEFYYLGYKRLYTELVNTLPWKRWKSYKTNPCRHEAMSKVIDAYFLMFEMFIRMAIPLGMATTDVVDMFYAKNKENHARQDRGYGEK